MRFRTTSGLDSAVDPIQMKNVTFEHVKGVGGIHIDLINILHFEIHLRLLLWFCFQVEEAKHELQEVVEFLKNPQKFTVLGGKLPKGMPLCQNVTILSCIFYSSKCVLQPIFRKYYQIKFLKEGLVLQWPLLSVNWLSSLQGFLEITLNGECTF